MMRKVMLLTLLSVLALFACTDHRYPTTLVVADSLCAVNPDSALHLLTQYKDSIQTASKAHRMYYHLLLADAMNKAYVDMSTDSILKEVADYYDRHGSANEQMRAHYLLGCAYRDMGEAPMALQGYQDAVDKADTLSQDCNYRLLTSVYGQMAEIFHKQNLPEDEIEVRRKCQKYALMAKDTLEFIRSYELMIKPYFLLGDTSAVRNIIENAHNLYLKNGDTLNAVRVFNGTYIYLFIQRNQTDKAKMLMDQYEKRSQLFDQEGNIIPRLSAYHYTKALYYLKRDLVDSAEYQVRKLLPIESLRTDAYRGLLTVYQLRNHSDSIAKYARLYEDALDSLSNRTRTETVHQMTSMYKYHRFQSIAYKESRSAERLRWFILLVIIVSAVSSFAIFLYFSQSKKKREDEYNKLVQKYETSLSDYNKLTDDVEKLRNHDEGLLAEKEHETELLREQLQHLRDDLLAIRQQDSILKFVNSDIIGKFKEMAKGKKGYSLPTNNDWEELQRQFARQMPLTYAAMGRNNILSFQELNTCILLITGFSNGEIAVLLDSSPQHITNMKKKINKKLFGEVSASSLDMHLRHISSMV